MILERVRDRPTERAIQINAATPRRRPSERRRRVCQTRLHGAPHHTADPRRGIDHVVLTVTYP